MADAVRPYESSTVAVVVVNFGSSTLLERNLAGLDAQARSGRIIVVDNLSTAEERRVVTDLAARHGWEVVPAPGNEGFGGGVNLGVRRARELGCDTVVLLNPDAVLSGEVLEQLHRHARAHPQNIVGPKIVDTAGATYFDGADVAMTAGITGKRALLAPPTQRRAWITGACMAFDIDVIERVGGFDESYFLYWEDVDLSLRVADSGGGLDVRTDLSVRHDEGGTQGERRGRAKSSTYYRYNCRNRLLFGTQHLNSRRELMRWIVRTPRESWMILLRGGRRQLVHDPMLAAAALRGTAEGLWIAVRALVGSPRFRSASE